MHKTTLVISQTKNADDAYESAVEFCKKLTDEQKGHDCFLPLKESRHCGSIFEETLRVDNITARKELERLTEMGTENVKRWIGIANQSLWDKTTPLNDALVYYKIATAPETFHVFDNTRWSNGDPVTDVVQLDLMIKHMTKQYDIPLWVSGFDVHF